MKIILFSFLVLLFLPIVLALDENNEVNKKCKVYKEYVNKAKEEWGRYKHVLLSTTIRNAFINGYNKAIDIDEKKLIADEMIVFPIYDKNEWYVLAGYKGCFVFWINLEPDKFVELIDGGDLGREQGYWKE